MSERKKLSETHPVLAEEWNYERNGELKPDMVSHGTDRKVWWRCSHGHEWEAYIYTRSAGCGCPYCAGNAVLAGYNDITTTHIWLLSEWDYEKNISVSPEQVASQSNCKIWWKCCYGHSWRAPVYSRTAGKGCPICAGRTVLTGYNDLATRNPELLTEWDYTRNIEVKPTEISVFSHRKVWWKDIYGHDWKASVSNRANGTGCPYCAGKKVLSGFNDLGSSDAVFLHEWDWAKNSPLTPEKVTHHSNQKVWWICTLGHSWKAAICSRYHTGCPICSNRTVLEGFNDLQTHHPELTNEWDYERNDGLTPEDVTYMSAKMIWWKCRRNHSWQAPVYRRSNGTGCPYCSRGRDHHTVTASIDDLATVSPHIAAEWDFERNGCLLPTQVKPFSTRKVWWLCSKGHHWRCSIQTRQKGTGCPYCAGHISPQTHIVT